MSDFAIDHTNTEPTVLIVDDTPLNLQVISSALKEKGYKLIITNSGEKALRFLDHTLPDLILLDVMMPELSGFEVCRIIKKQKRFADIPVIFLTAKNDVNDIVEGFEAGAVDYIVKPFNAREVFIRISTHIQLKQARQMLVEKNRMMEELNRSLEESKNTIEKDAEHLSKLNAEKNKFFSIIAHDLRGPFTGLLGISDILKSQMDQMDTAEITEMVGLLSESANQVFDLLENLLVWARMQMNSMVFTPAHLFLKPLALDLGKLIEHHTTLKNLTFHIEVDEALQVFADVNMLKTLLRNLVSNALKFTPKGGKITLSAWQQKNGEIVVAVKDNGIGMHKSLIDKLFMLDQKTSRPGTDGESSSGLGLLLCKEFIEKHGGRIWVESEEGKGSSFFLTFPV